MPSWHYGQRCWSQSTSCQCYSPELYHSSSPAWSGSPFLRMLNTLGAYLLKVGPPTSCWFAFGALQKPAYWYPQKTSINALSCKPRSLTSQTPPRVLCPKCRTLPGNAFSWKPVDPPTSPPLQKNQWQALRNQRAQHAEALGTALDSHAQVQHLSVLDGGYAPAGSTLAIALSIFSLSATIVCSLRAPRRGMLSKQSWRRTSDKPCC